MQADISLPTNAIAANRRPSPARHCQAHIIVVQEPLVQPAHLMMMMIQRKTQDDAVCMLQCCTVTSSQLLFATTGEPLVSVRATVPRGGISPETDWARFPLRRATGGVLRDTDVTGLG